MSTLKSFLTLAFLSLCILCWGSGGYKIKVKLNDYQQDTLLMGYQLGDKNYVKDTAIIGKDHMFTFEGKEALDGGIYLLIFMPDKKFIQFLIGGTEQNFAIEASVADPFESLQFKGSKENISFYQYLKFLNGERTKAEALSKERDAAKDSLQKLAITEKLEQLNKDVKTYQINVIHSNPSTLTASLVKAAMEPEIPAFTGTDKEIQTKKFVYYKQHYLDNVEVNDERLMRTPVLQEKFDTYLNKLTAQHPDSISVAIDYLLQRVKGTEETYKYFLITYLNAYANSKFVGMDAVYVHLALNYYGKGLAPWTDSAQVSKIVENASKLEPLLIGKQAPNILMQRRDGTKISLNDVKSDYTVLVFWAYDCGHCKKSMPDLVKFYEKFKPQGVEVFAVCAKLLDDVKGCWEYIDANHLDMWVNVVDPRLESRYKQIYDVVTTPRVFVLDKNKKIMSKSIGMDQLEGLMPKLMEIKNM